MNTLLMAWATVAIAAIGPRDEASSPAVELKSSRLTVLTGEEREQFLAAHNAARSKVGVEPVDWSDEISKQALQSLQQQKDALIDAAKEGWTEGLAVLPKHRTDTDYGENVAGWVGGRSKPAELAVELWLREKDAFDKLNAGGPYRVGD